jgi:hypothetical protein
MVAKMKTQRDAKKGLENLDDEKPMYLFLKLSTHRHYTLDKSKPTYP